MDRIAWVRHQHGVASTQRGKREMRDAFLRANGDDRLGFGIEFDAPPPQIPLTDRATQARDAARYRVTMRVGPLHGLDQLFDDMLRRSPVRIAHPEVDDVLAAPASGHLQL